MKILDNIFQNGELISSNADPLRQLVIRRYVDRIYYCRDKNEPDGNDLVFFERELTAWIAHLRVV
jgi:hypothetical protein